MNKVTRLAVKCVLILSIFALSGCGGGGGGGDASPPPPSVAATKAVIVFTSAVPAGSSEQIGSVDMLLALPAGVTLPIPSGQVPEANLYFSGNGEVFKALPGASASILGNYTPATPTAKATVGIHLTAILNNSGTAQGINPGEFATLICDLTPGATVFASDFATPLSDLLVANTAGNKLLDSSTNTPNPAQTSISYKVTLQ